MNTYHLQILHILRKLYYTLSNSNISWRKYQYWQQEKISVKKCSSLHRLNPFRSGCVWRVGKRLSKLAMPEELKHSVILPKSSHLTRWILSWIHNLVSHSGRNQMLSKLRQKYLVIKADSAARKMIKECVFCRCWHTPPSIQRMWPAFKLYVNLTTLPSPMWELTTLAQLKQRGWASVKSLIHLPCQQGSPHRVGLFF